MKNSEMWNLETKLLFLTLNNWPDFHDKNYSIKIVLLAMQHPQDYTLNVQKSIYCFTISISKF